MVMMVAHLGVIEDKVREDDQIEACCTRTRLGVHLGGSVRPWQQRIEERTDRISPHIPHHAAHSVRVRGREQLPDVQVLRDVIRQVIQERLVRVIREDHLSYSISKNSKKKIQLLVLGRRKRTTLPFARRTWLRLDPEARRLRPTRALCDPRREPGCVGETLPARAQRSI